MGCSWISLVSLIVLVWASVVANMKTTTYTTFTRTRTDETSAVTTDKSIGSQDKQLSTETIANTSELVATTKCHLSDNESITENLTQPSNCKYETVTAQLSSSSEIISPGTNSGGQLPVTYRDYPEYIHFKNLGEVAPYITNIPGYFTNSLAIIVAINIKPLHPSEIYMTMLGCADLVTVTARLTFAMANMNVIQKALADCQLLMYIWTCAQVYSNMILVSWTVERFIAIIFPIKLAPWCSIRNTKVTLALLLLVCMAITVPYITEMGLIYLWSGQEMINTCKYLDFMGTVWFHIESVYYIYIPMILVCVRNITMLCKLRSMAKARISMACNQETIENKSNENRKMTVLLLTISGTFLCFHIPYAVVMIINYLYPDITVLIRKDPQMFAKYLLYTNLGYVITECQNSINFFLYCISGTKFRSTFRKVFCKHFPWKGAETTRTTTY